MSEPKGQILPDSEFGKVLTELAIESDTIVEVGTWHGEGSTRCIANGLIYPQQRFITLEQDPTVSAGAKARYDDSRIEFINAHVLDVADRLPQQIDLMLFDGSDMTTDEEFKTFSPSCTVVALDDTNELKNRNQRDFLMSSPDWIVTHHYPKDRHGWLVARKLNEFDKLYKGGGWDGKGSGPGSTSKFTHYFRDKLEIWMSTMGIKSVFDLGCGDWQWQRLIDWKDIQYVGWDASFVAVDWFGYKTNNPNISFFTGDPTLKPHRVKSTDLLIVKDVMHHTTFEERLRIIEFSKQFKWVLWVLDMENETRPCFWPERELPKWEMFYQFDLTVENYHYGIKTAFLQKNR